MRKSLLAAAGLLAACLLFADTTGLLRDNSYLRQLRPGHPRLFCNAETLPAIRQAVKRNPGEFNQMKEFVDQLPDDPPFEPYTDRFSTDADGKIHPKTPGTASSRLVKYDGARQAARAALVYAIAGDKRYLDKTKAYLELYLRVLAWSEKGWNFIDLNGNTRINAMLAYDLIWNDLTPEERRHFILPILRYVRDAQPDGRFTFRRTIGGFQDGNYGEPALQYFLGVTLYGDGIADAEAATMLKNGAELFVKMLDFRDEISAGSGLLASATVGYAFGSYPYATHLFFYSWEAAFGENIADRWQQMRNYHRFFRGMTFLPDEKGDYLVHGIGDMHHGDNRFETAMLYNHMAQNIHFYGTIDPGATAEMYGILSELPAARRIFPFWDYPMLPFLCTRFDPAKIKAVPEGARCYFYAPSFGLLTFWSDRKPTGTYGSFRFGASQGNHQHYDELSFVIFKHDFLALDAGSRSETDHHHNFAAQSVAHNTLLIHEPNEPMPHFWRSWSNRPDDKTYYNHGGQNSNTAAKALALHSGSGFVYAAGDATGSYSKGKCREAIRQFVWLKPDVFVIYDRLESVRPDQTKQFLLHTVNRPELQPGNVWQADHHNGRLFLKTLLPTGAAAEVIGGPGKEFFASGRNWPLEPDKKYQLAGNWRLEIEAPEPTAKVRYLHVLQATDRSNGTMVASRVRQLGDLDEATVETPDGKRWILQFRRNGEVGLRLSSMYPDGRIEFDRQLPNQVEKETQAR